MGHGVRRARRAPLLDLSPREALAVIFGAGWISACLVLWVLMHLAAL